MTFENLAATLEERLLFYAGVADLLGEAAVSGDEEKLLGYSGLERETGDRITALARCFHARKNEAPDPRTAELRIEAAASRAEAASRGARSRLGAHKEDILRRIRDTRKMQKTPYFTSSTPAPGLVDLRA